MYSTPRQPDQVPISLATEILADDTEQLLQSLHESLTEAQKAMQAVEGDSSKAAVNQDVSRRLDSAFEAARRILGAARASRAQRT